MVIVTECGLNKQDEDFVPMQFKSQFPWESALSKITFSIVKDAGASILK